MEAFTILGWVSINTANDNTLLLHPFNFNPTILKPLQQTKV